MGDIYFTVGILITVAATILLIAPVFVGVAFGYQSKTYLGQVKAGLCFLFTIAVMVIVSMFLAIAIAFIFGDYDIVHRIVNLIK